MSYMDIWIYDSRPRMKVFLCYFLIFIAFFIFSDVMMYAYTKSLYKPMTSYEINVTSPQVTVETAEASNVNGNVKGTIKNTTDEYIDGQYLKFDLYTTQNIKAGTKYVEISNLAPGQKREYEMGFRLDKIKSVQISMVDESEINEANSDELKQEPCYGPAGLVSAIILGYVFL